MAIHSSTVAQKIPWTEEPGRLQSMGSPKVGHDQCELQGCQTEYRAIFKRCILILKNYLILAVLDLCCCTQAFPSFSMRGALLQLQCAGYSLRWLPLLWSTGFSSCGMWAPQLQLVGSRVLAQQLWHMGLVAPWHVGSFETRDRTHVPSISSQILNHWTIREALFLVFKGTSMPFSKVAVLVCISTDSSPQ